MDEDDDRRGIISFERLADLIAYLRRLRDAERRHLSEVDMPQRDLDQDTGRDGHGTRSTSPRLVLEVEWPSA